MFRLVVSVVVVATVASVLARSVVSALKLVVNAPVLSLADRLRRKPLAPMTLEVARLTVPLLLTMAHGRMPQLAALAVATPEKFAAAVVGPVAMEADAVPAVPAPVMSEAPTLLKEAVENALRVKTVPVPVAVRS